MAFDVDVEVVLPRADAGRARLEARHRHIVAGQRTKQAVDGTGLVRRGQRQRGAVLARPAGLQVADHGEAGAVVRIVLDVGLDRAQAVANARALAGDGGDAVVVARHAGRFGVGRDGAALDVRVVVEPDLALRQRLRVGADGG